MDPFPAEWRTLGQAEPPSGNQVGPSTKPGGVSRSLLPWLIAGALVVAGVVGIIGVVFAAWSAESSEVVLTGGELSDGRNGPGAANAGAANAIGLEMGALATPAGSASITVPSEIIVDVEGAVLRPGLQALPAGARVGDAVAAAGGFSPRADLAASAERLNLAEPLSDGAKVHVPALGETAADASGTAGSAAAGTGSGGPGAVALIDLNNADQPALESLPGIGPVTAVEIIAARSTAPFASVDELLSRGIVGPVTFEQVRALVTIGG